jgi:hypothetical protein
VNSLLSDRNMMSTMDPAKQAQTYATAAVAHALLVIGDRLRELV